MWPFSRKPKEDPVKDALRQLANEMMTSVTPASIEDIHRRYEGMAHEPESGSGGPLLAGRLKYAEMVKIHGQL